MKKQNIEVEGGEFLIQSKEGHYAVIPAKHRQEVMDMVKGGCDDCINNYIQTLPKDSDYAEDGTIVSLLYTQKTGKDWSTAKQEGLTTGSYDDNMKLRQRLLSGEFDNKVPQYDVSKISPRKGVRKNADGTVSTHKMAYTEADGKYYAYPTLFQDEGKWIEKDDKNDWEAFKEAKNRKEIYEFNTEKEASDFAKGSWKKDNLKQENYLPKERDYAEGGSLSPSWNEVKAVLNPKNWGVPDYTDKGSKGAAYASAKKAGEKEFMWNNQRFNTKYAGTVQEEVKSYFPEYNVITGVEPANYVKTALSMIDKSKSTKWPHVFTGDLNKKTAIDYPYGYKYSELGINAYDNTKYYASKINTDSIYDKLSKMIETGLAGEYDVIDNNCTGTVCAGLDLPYGKLPLPSTVPRKLKSKYPTKELTSNVTDSKELNNLYGANEDSLLNTSINTLEKHSSHKSLIKVLQDALFKKGYKLPESTKENGTLDGILGDETKNALLDYQIKNKKK